MDGDLFERIVMGSRHVFATIARMFTRYTANVQYRMLRYDKFEHNYCRGSNIDRYTILFRFACRIEGNKHFLTSDSVSAFSAKVTLISSNVSDRYNFAYLAIASSRFALAAAS